MASRIEYQGKPAAHATFVDITERKQAETKLKESEYLYRTLTENSLTGIYMFREGHYLFANEMYCKMYGYSWDDLKSMDPLDLIAPECREQISERVKKRLAGEDVLSDYETKIIRKDGTIRDAHLKATRIMYEGKPTVQGNIIDITERKRAEEALGQSEEQYRSLFETSTNAILIRNRDGIITMVNEAALILLGATKAEDLIGKAYLDLVHPEDRALSAERVEKTFLIALGQHEAYEHGTKAISPREHRMVNLNGDIIYVESTAVAFHHKEELFIQGIFRDITGRKRAEVALRESEEKYRSLVANATDAIFIVQDGRIKFPNPITLKLVGYSQEELATLPFVNLIHPEDRAMVLDNYSRRLKGEEVPSTYTFRVVNKGGEELWGQLNAVLIMWEGRPAVLCFIRDITPQKRLEAQYLHAQKMEAVGTLAGGIAHDFNNLLQAILGYAELLLLGRGKQDPGYQELQEIKRAAQRGGELTYRLLTFSRRVQSELTPVNLNQEVNQIQRLLQRTISKMIDIELNLADDLRTINGDPAQIEQALMNLALNARDAMPEGGRLRIGTKNVTLDEEYCRMHLGVKAGDYVLLSVTDTGYGMNQEILGHLFEPFYTTKGVGRGTGLGLSMVYGIVRSHDGYIFCDSVPGKGTTFEIYLPVIEQRLGMEESKEERIPRGGKETILLIDDEESIRDLGSQILSRFGYTVLTASDGESGLEQYQKGEGKIDLVILDLIMPGMGGRRCLEELLRMNPKVKVVIASGYSVDGHTREALEAGAKNSVSKPYAIRQMLKMVRDVLDKNE
jgi:PAS domain S-box-containing protein